MKGQFIRVVRPVRKYSSSKNVRTAERLRSRDISMESSWPLQNTGIVR